MTEGLEQMPDRRAEAAAHAVAAERIQEIKANLADVRREIQAIAEDCGRDPAKITLIAVSKTFSAADAAAAVQAGVTDLGENRVQEFLPKATALQELGCAANWHLIGTLQRNKVRDILGRTALIHSVDRPALLQELSRRSVQQDCVTSVLLQVNISGEASKHGFTATDLTSQIEDFARLPGLRLCGLMTMAPLVADADQTLPVFEQTKILFDALKAQLGSPDWQHLSMGMSQDFRQAVRCGATHLRIGSAIFGRRRR